MIEAVIEDKDVKEQIFFRADQVLPADAVLASNTSSIPITSLAADTVRPDRVIGMHFFNPVPVLKLVEVVRGRDTSDETVEAIVAFAEELGKVPALANDFPGFVSNRILMPFINEAVWALHDGVAEAEAIDTIAKLGFAHPMGPLALADRSASTRASRSWRSSTPVSATTSTRRARCSASTSRPAAWAGSRGKASAVTSSALRALRRPAWIQTLAREFAQAEIEPNAAGGIAPTVSAR